MTRSWHSHKIGLDHYVRCASGGCMSAGITYAGAWVPLCGEHAQAVRDSLCKSLGRPPREPRRDIGVRGRRHNPNRPSLVYYGLTGGHVKIGMTQGSQQPLAQTDE